MVVEAIQDKLARRIFDSKEFTQDYESLLVAEFGGRNGLSIESIKRLLQTSAIFAGTSERPENDRFRRLSYNIIVYLINKYSDEYDGLMRIAQDILIRLGNFPAVKMCIDNRKATDYYSIYFDSEEVFNPLVNRHILIKASQNQFSFKNITDYFTDFQAQVYKHLSEGKSISYSAPTSAGKSFILGHYISKKFQDEKDLSIVYVVPTRALINQVQLTLNNQFTRLGVSDVAVFTSSIQVVGQGVKAPCKKLFVLTQERLKTLLSETDSKEVINILIVDEAQKIGEDARGILLEEVVTTVIEQNPSVQLIFLSPFARNPRKLPEIFRVEATTEIEKTALSPVSQNIFYVELNQDKAKADVYLVFWEKKESILLRTYHNVPNISSDLRKKVWLASHFRSESNIVYCNSPSECRKVAKLLAEEIEDDHSSDKEISGAIRFLADFIHPDYYLIDYLKKGIGYHYGNMPTLVRLLVEDLFKAKKLAYICCTSTLLEGVNLPAKNIFLYKPTKGMSNPIDKLSFWNLAGRAGRLLKDFYGNIYCLNVEEWSGYKPEIESIEHEIESAFETTIIEEHSKIIEYLKDLYRQEKEKGEVVEAVVTRFIIGELKKGNDRFIEELLGRNKRLDENNLNEIRQAVVSICKDIKVPAAILEENSNIDPRRQNELYLQLRSGTLPVPIHPGKSGFYDSLVDLFNFITEFFKDKPTTRTRYLAFLASQWVDEKSLNELIRNKITYANAQGDAKINEEIEKLLNDLEKEIRFEYHKYLKCYIAIQSFVYEENNWDKSEIAESLPHYLELGAFKQTTLMLQLIGISRSSAITITRQFSPEFADVEDCKKWLNNNLKSLKQELPQIAYKEVLRILNRYK